MKYEVIIWNEIGYNNYVSERYGYYDDHDQACDIANELRGQGLSAIVDIVYIKGGL